MSAVAWLVIGLVLVILMGIWTQWRLEQLSRKWDRERRALWEAHKRDCARIWSDD